MRVFTRIADAGDQSAVLIVSEQFGDNFGDNFGDMIEVSVLSTQAGQVRLAVRAPRDLPVHTAEVYEQIAQEIEGKIQDEVVKGGRTRPRSSVPKRWRPRTAL